MLQKHDLIIFKGADYFENFEFVHHFWHKGNNTGHSFSFPRILCMIFFYLNFSHLDIFY